MQKILLLKPTPIKTGIKKILSKKLPEATITVYKDKLQKARTAILLIDAVEGPTQISRDQLIEMRINNTQNVFGFIINAHKSPSRELLKLVKYETIGLLEMYGYWNDYFTIFNDKDDIDEFVSELKENINNTDQLNFDLPNFFCKHCGNAKHYKFSICPSCNRKQKKSFLDIIFGRSI